MSGAGGPATTTSSATNTLNNAPVMSLARALGGLPGISFSEDSTAPSGDATATASGAAAGPAAVANVRAEATSVQRPATAGGNDGPPPLAASRYGGTALALATGTAASGEVSALARTYRGALTDLSGESSATLLNTASAEARARLAQPLPTSSAAAGRNSFAFVTGAPVLADIATLLGGGHPQNTAAFAPQNGEVFATALLGGSSPTAPFTGPFTATSTLSLSLDLAPLAVLRDLEIGFAAPQVSGLGFGSLEFTLTVQGASVLDLVFVNPLAALAYFDDQVLDFGPIGSGVTGTLDVQASFILTSANPGSVFSTQLLAANATPTPEPRSALLLAAGAAFLGSRARRRAVRRG